MNAPFARRNDPCPCGSGARYKDCHGKLGAPAADDAVALHAQGYALCKAGRFEEGMPMLERAVALQPSSAAFHASLGTIRYVLGELASAIAELARAVELAPQAAEAHSNLAMALRDAGDAQGALGAVRRALELSPDLPAARLNHAMVLLALGRFEEAWRAYVWRPHPAANLRDLGIPATIAHATRLPDLASDPWITLHGEQGVGDVIFFLRYAPELRARGAKIRFWGDARLAPMLLRSGVVDEAVSGDAPRGLDPSRLVWIGDLPALLGREAEFPAPARLRADPARVTAMRARLSACGPGPFIALTWRAGLARRGKAVLSKAIHPGLLGAALAGLAATFVSVQRDPLAGENAALERALGAKVADFSALNADLDDMLGLLDVVDEYVGVSNTNTHLRASLGRSARVLLPWPAEWRWLGAGDASPWFPGFPLYRADSAGEWGPALERLRAGLRAVSR